MLVKQDIIIIIIIVIIIIKNTSELCKTLNDFLSANIYYFNEVVKMWQFYAFYQN